MLEDYMHVILFELGACYTLVSGSCTLEVEKIQCHHGICFTVTDIQRNHHRQLVIKTNMNETQYLQLHVLCD